MKLRYRICGTIFEIFCWLLSPILEPLGWFFSSIFGTFQQFVFWFANYVVGPFLWRSEIQEFRDKSELCFAKYEGQRLWEMLEHSCGERFDTVEYPLYSFDEVVDEICRRRVMWPCVHRFLSWRSRRAEVRWRKRWIRMYGWDPDDMLWHGFVTDFPAHRMKCSIDFYDIVWGEVVAEEEIYK